MLRIAVRSIALGFCLLLGVTCQAGEPGWNGTIIAQGAEKARIEATPIICREYRPFHFYGNTIRRKYYRGNPLPLPRDLVNGIAALLRRD